MWAEVGPCGAKRTVLQRQGLLNGHPWPCPPTGSELICGMRDALFKSSALEKGFSRGSAAPGSADTALIVVSVLAQSSRSGWWRKGKCPEAPGRSPSLLPAGDGARLAPLGGISRDVPLWKNGAVWSTGELGGAGRWGRHLLSPWGSLPSHRGPCPGSPVGRSVAPLSSSPFPSPRTRRGCRQPNLQRSKWAPPPAPPPGAHAQGRPASAGADSQSRNPKARAMGATATQVDAPHSAVLGLRFPSGTCAHWRGACPPRGTTTRSQNKE